MKYSQGVAIEVKVTTHMGHKAGDALDKVPVHHTHTHTHIRTLWQVRDILGLGRKNRGAGKPQKHREGMKTPCILNAGGARPTELQELKIIFSTEVIICKLYL